MNRIRNAVKAILYILFILSDFGSLQRGPVFVKKLLGPGTGRC